MRETNMEIMGKRLDAINLEVPTLVTLEAGKKSSVTWVLRTKESEKENVEKTSRPRRALDVYHVETT